MAVTTNSSGDSDKSFGLNSGVIASILTSLQQGVTGINNLTQTMSQIFPSS